MSPVVESDNGIERFVTKDPLISLKEGDLANVPIFLGVTQDEFAYKALRKYTLSILVLKIRNNHIVNLQPNYEIKNGQQK